MRYVLFISLFCFFSCLKKEICVDKKEGIIDSLYVPKENKFGEEVPIYVRYEIENGCGDFYDYRSSGINRHFDLYVTLQYRGCECAELFQYGSRIISFSPFGTGEFYLSYLLKGAIAKTDTFYVK
jgi:hypothetical protein